MKKKILVLAIIQLIFFLIPISLLSQTTYVVNDSGSDPDINPGDKICATTTGKCTLRAAIQESNLDRTVSYISFSKPMKINDFNLPSLSASITTIDASTQWNEQDNIPGVSLSSYQSSGVQFGLRIEGDFIVIKGIRFYDSYVGGTGIVLLGNYATIGGDAYNERNVFLTDIGIWMYGKWNKIKGNYFGTVNGDFPYAIDLSYGLLLDSSSSNNTIENNLIGGQTLGAGISVRSDDNVIQNNIIGLSKNEMEPLPNLHGIEMYSASNNVIKANRIAKNEQHGIDVRVGSSDNSIVENKIAAFHDYDTSEANGGDGIHIVGGTHYISKNLIQSNLGHGISIYNSKNSDIQNNRIEKNKKNGLNLEESSHTKVSGNGIGLNGQHGVSIVGDTSVSNILSNNGVDGNKGHGILLEKGANYNLIGDFLQEKGNWIRSNLQDGIRLTGAGTSDNMILSNVLGIHKVDPVLDSPYDTLKPNGHHGIALYNGANNNYIGQMNSGNTIVGSGWSGIAIVNSYFNKIISNRIGTEWSVYRWGNQFFGIHVVGGSQNFLGLNKVAYNGAHAGEAGICIDGPNAVQNDISRNSIHDNHGAGIVLMNSANHNLQPPSLLKVTPASVQGQTKPNSIIEIFSDHEDEGMRFEGDTIADSNGLFEFNGQIRGPKVTAVCRSGGDASVFSLSRNVPRTLPFLFLLDE